MLASCELSFSSGSKGAEHRNAGAQHIHRMRLLRHQPQHLQDLLRKRTLGGESAGKFFPLLDRRQLAVEEKVSDFLEVRFLRHLVNVVAAIHQAGVGIDPADFRFAGDHAGKSWAVGGFGFSIHKFS